ncbi:MAG: hypothetical protein JJ900_10600 [Rhodospirillales bacterium]|nr:hypothetical protein [Rhodospirillales bacterium]MBO6787288.1 hypothetical protein [Rhodospirillales bacterium]
MSRYVTLEAGAIRKAAFGAALALWESRRGDRIAPRWKHDVDFLDFEPRVIPRMMLVEVDGRPGVGVYRFWGTGIKTYDGSDQTGGRVSTQETPDMQEDFVAQYEQVVATGTPRVFATRIRLLDPTERFKYEASLRLPFSSDNETVDWVLSIDYYANAWAELLDELGVSGILKPG